MPNVWAKVALTADGWRDGVTVSVAEDGAIEAVTADTEPGDAADAAAVGILLPAPVNLHSHAFQRAMAGLTEARGPDPQDTFWTWRVLMYRFLDQLTPDDVEAIAALVQMEMLEAGYAAVGEFHYLHHRPDGEPYASLAEMSERIAAAANGTGIGLTLLPVLYQQGGCDGRPLGPGQRRFGNDPDRFARLVDGAEAALRGLPADARLGVAPHSLRAVTADALAFAANLRPDGPVHIHVAEQRAEVDEVMTHLGRLPVDWLLSNHEVDRRWCLIHATQMIREETETLARSGAVAGLCPITEANLGDGIFDGLRYREHDGAFGVGSDSNIRISLAEELRALDYAQRLGNRVRAAFATPTRSTGRVLLEGAAAGGARAAGRNAGVIGPGRLADLMALDAAALPLFDKDGDALLDSYIFAGDDSLVTDVWSAGRHMVRGGRHIGRDAITARYRTALSGLKDRL